MALSPDAFQGIFDTVQGDIRHCARKTLFCHEILEDFKKQGQGQSTLKN